MVGLKDAKSTVQERKGQWNCGEMGVSESSQKKKNMDESGKEDERSNGKGRKDCERPGGRPQDCG
jgi:hypothetical protein